MNRFPTTHRRLASWVTVVTLASVCLSACSSKPPGCADEQTVSLVQQIVLDRWKERTTKNRGQDENTPYIEDYANGLKVEIRNIVSNGYNADARKHACTGEFVLRAVSGKAFSASREFSSQSTADGSSKFIVQVVEVDSLLQSLTYDLLHYMNDRKTDSQLPPAAH